MRKEEKEQVTSFNPHDYDYMDNMPLDGWAWEFVRRNESYRNAYLRVKENVTKSKNADPFKFTTSPTEETVEIYKILWNIVEKEFHIKPFYSDEDYGAGIPAPDLRYNQLSDKIKPILNKAINPVAVLTPKDIEQKARTLNFNSIEFLWDTGKDLACDAILRGMLSPNNSHDTIYLGISMNAKRRDVDRQLRKIIKGNIKPEYNIHIRRDEWKTYLQVFDLTKTGLSNKEIARIILPNKSNKYPDCKASNEIKVFRRKANSLIKKGFQKIL